MTHNEKILDCLRENPTATNSQIAEFTGLDKDLITTYLNRLKNKGSIEVEKEGTLRTITVLKESPISKHSYKKEIIETMINRYMEDFEGCELLNVRIEVGKVILRLLEKL